MLFDAVCAAGSGCCAVCWQPLCCVTPCVLQVPSAVPCPGRHHAVSAVGRWLGDAGAPSGAGARREAVQRQCLQHRQQVVGAPTHCSISHITDSYRSQTASQQSQAASQQSLTASYRLQVTIKLQASCVKPEQTNISVISSREIDHVNLTYGAGRFYLYALRYRVVAILLKTVSVPPSWAYHTALFVDLFPSILRGLPHGSVC